MSEKILVLGATGMLGNAVASELIRWGNYEVTLSARLESQHLLERFPQRPGKVSHILFDPLAPYFTGGTIRSLGGPYDYIINCIGVIKPNVQKLGMWRTLYINSVWPHQLAQLCKTMKTKLIHITTDCVYSGLGRVCPYMESDAHDCLDVYGKSKSLGEPIDNAMVLRTSIIGMEIHNHSSLISWVLSEKGNTVRGFTNHFWNGITTNQYGQLCTWIIDRDMWREGLFHVHSPDVVNKHQLLSIFNNVFDLGLTIDPAAPGDGCYRVLGSEKFLMSELGQFIPDIETQVACLKPRKL